MQMKHRNISVRLSTGLFLCGPEPLFAPPVAPKLVDDPFFELLITTYVD